MIIALAIIGIVVACILNSAADRQHRQNAEIIKANGADQSPVVQAGHTANGCTGVLLWLALAGTAFVVMSGLAAGG